MWISTTTASLNMKVYSLQIHNGMAISYDPTCENFDLCRDKLWRTGVCVTDNVLYVYYERLSLMWYDFEQL